MVPALDLSSKEGVLMRCFSIKYLSGRGEQEAFSASCSKSIALVYFRMFHPFAKIISVEEIECDE